MNYTHDTERWLRSNARLHRYQGNEQMALNFEVCAEDVRRLQEEIAWLKKRNGIIAGRAAELEEQISDATTLWDDDVEARYIKEAERLNCPCCGGSGHVDDCDEPVQELKAEFAALKEALAKILGWREYRDTSAIPVERIEAIAREALAKLEAHDGK